MADGARLSGKIAWVTGASRGIGLAIAHKFAAEGARLVVTARETKRAEETVAVLPGSGHIGLGYDAGDSAAVVDALKRIHGALKGLDILVNNAGILEAGLIGTLQPESVKSMLQTNTESTIYHMQAAARLMMRARAGSIINMSSIIGLEGAPGLTAYAASKAAIIGATKSAAKELGPAGIRINAIAPGFIETNMTMNLDDKTRENFLGGIALRRAGQPNEVAEAALFLASDAASYITGQVLGVDGCMVV